MSLHVNLILDSERRSGSNVSKKFIIQVAAVVVPVIIVLGFVSFFFVARQAKNKVASLQESWNRMEATQGTVKNIQVNLISCRNVANDITGWRDSGINMPDLITAISEAVPDTMQLTRMTLTDNPGLINGLPGRGGTMFLRGKVGGSKPDEDVSRLEKLLEDHHSVESADVMRYEAETATGQKPSVDDEALKIFDLECLLKARMIRK